VKVIVVGGTGFLGSLALGALRRVPGVEAQAASRRGEVRVDLADPATFSVLDGADVVIDLADATTTPPDALASYCLRKGLLLIETTSDLPAIDRIAQALRSAPGEGTVVLGAGIFTGLSNLVAHAVTQAGGSVRLGIRSSPYSGAGKGTVALMASALSIPAVSFAGGRRVEHPPISRGPTMTFLSASAPSLRIPLAESVMLPASTKAEQVDVYFSPKPSLLVYAFLLIPGFLLRARWFGRFMAAYFGLLRTVVLSGRASTTDLVAEGDRGRVQLSAADGMRAGGVAIAAIACAAASSRRPGCVFVDEVVQLDDIVARMHTIEPSVVAIMKKFNDDGTS